MGQYQVFWILESRQDNKSNQVTCLKGKLAICVLWQWTFKVSANDLSQLILCKEIASNV